MTEPVDRKILDPQTLRGVVQAARAAGRTIVHCHGCFDIVHPGHIRYLRFARQLADVLVVSLTSDDAIDKGPDHPYIPQELRAENLAALEFVDWVVIDPHSTAAELLELLRPDVYVKGREYAQSNDPRFLREREIVEGGGGRVVFHSGDVVFSSTRLVHSMERDEQLDECRLRTLCRRGHIDATTVRAALERFPGVRVIVVGDLIRERHVFCDASEAAEDAPLLSLHELGAAWYWGGAAGLALQFRALGASPVVVTAAAASGAVQAAETDLGARGVALRTLSQRRELVERQTFMADDTKLFRVNTGVCQPLDTAWERHAEAIIREELDDCGALAGASRSDARRAGSVLVWCDHGYGMVTPGLVRAVTPAAQRVGAIIVGCAPGRRGDLTALHETDLLCTTERRLREALHDMGSGLPSVTWELLNRTRSRRALVALHKRGLIGFDGHTEREGSLQSDRPEACPPAQSDRPEACPPAQRLARRPDAAPNRLRSEFVPTLAVHYTDMTGVDEAVLAAAALTLTTAGSLAMATYVAAGAEALAASRPGRTIVATSDLLAWVDTRSELRPQNRFLPDAATIGDLARLAPPLPTAAECLAAVGCDSAADARDDAE